MSNFTYQQDGPEATQKKGKRAGKKRTEAQLIKWAKEDIKRSREAGRDAYYISEEHHCTQYLVLQLDLNSLRARLRSLEQALLNPPPPASTVLSFRKPASTARDILDALRRGKVA